MRVAHLLGLLPPGGHSPSTPSLSPTTTTRLLGRRVWLRCGDEKRTFKSTRTGKAWADALAAEKQGPPTIRSKKFYRLDPQVRGRLKRSQRACAAHKKQNGFFQKGEVHYYSCITDSILN
ncbi:hypothetical protein CDAR_256981 [Caerostris darwini]|uniref:Uncharacterized protein n=1 Tax=Caerostris darwini TaxID=1538125 RepID=A0AAV4PY10_9ARAC|nr:hypothetical protein CDAR_256981 [Caerostris darwini]